MQRYFQCTRHPPKRLLHAADVNAAVAQSDVLITATTGKGPLFDLAAVQPGTHINAVGSDTKGKRELPEGLLAKARVFVDDAAQSHGIGELQWAPDTGCTEIGDVLSGKAAFARDVNDITVFDMIHQHLAAMERAAATA